MRSACRELVVVALVLAAFACKRKEKQAPVDPMLEWKRLDELPSFSIVLDEAARASLSESPKTWVKGSFRSGETTLADIGVRLKGHRSMRKLADKPALKLRFDKYVKGQSFRGVKRLTLNNMVEDPTMLREVLGYRLYRKLDVPAPAAFYAKVDLNGENYGLYAVIETIDKSFLESRFADASGGLYEGEYGCDLYLGDVDGFDRDSGDKKAGRTDLQNFARAAGDDPRSLFSDSGPIAMKPFLAYLAVSAFIGDFDGYRHAHNYRIYHEPTERKWYFIPWGIDRAFKQDLSIYESYGRLARRCFDDAICRRDYVRVQRAVSEAFVELNLEEGAAALAAFIDPVLATTERRRPSSKVINRAREKLAKFLRQRPSQIAKETACLDENGNEIDADGDGFGCLDCNDSDPLSNPAAVDVCGDAVDNDCSGAIDDNPECDSCERVETTGQVFLMCDFPRSFARAEEHCRARGGELATIDSKDANEALDEAAKRIRDGRWWLGYSDREIEGAFSAPRESTFVNWAKGEPDNHTCNQDCAVLDSKRLGRWHDTHCGQVHPFICELEAPATR